jgi:isopentenyl phosphate kinase
VELGDILIRIYALDPQNYAVNEAHVKEEFEKLSLAGLTAAERLADMTRAMQRLTQTVADLEAQMAMNPMATKPESVFLIQEEPDIEELLS